MGGQRRKTRGDAAPRAADRRHRDRHGLEASEFTGLPQATPTCAGTVDTWAETVNAGAGNSGALLLIDVWIDNVLR